MGNHFKILDKTHINKTIYTFGIIYKPKKHVTNKQKNRRSKPID